MLLASGETAGRILFVFNAEEFIPADGGVR
jgi:hypothetical protein